MRRDQGCVEGEGVLRRGQNTPSREAGKQAQHQRGSACAASTGAGYGWWRRQACGVVTAASQPPASIVPRTGECRHALLKRPRPAIWHASIPPTGSYGAVPHQLEGVAQQLELPALVKEVDDRVVRRDGRRPWRQRAVRAIVLRRVQRKEGWRRRVGVAQRGRGVGCGSHVYDAPPCGCVGA